MSYAGNVVLALAILGATTPSLAADEVTNTLTWKDMKEQDAATLKQGVAFVSRTRAESGDYQLVILVANQPIADRLGPVEEDPEQGFTNLSYGGGDAAQTLSWIMLKFDDQGGSGELEYGSGMSSGNLWDSQFTIDVDSSDGKRVAATLTVIDPDANAKGRLEFDLPISRSSGVAADVLALPARYQAAAPVAKQAARTTYETFVRELRAGNASAASDVVRGDLDRPLSELEMAQANTRPEAAGLLQEQIALWPEHVYASTVSFSYGADGKRDMDAPNAKLAVCGKGADGKRQAIAVEMWKFGADDHWWIVGRSEEASDLTRFGTPPDVCGRS